MVIWLLVALFSRPFNRGLEWLEMVFDFFYVLSSLFNFPFCVTLVFSFCQKNIFFVISLCCQPFLSSSPSSSSSFMPIFFFLTKKKKNLSFRARIHLLRSQPTQSSNHFPIFFFSTMHNLSEIFFVSFAGVLLPSLPVFLSFFSFKFFICDL